MDGQACHSFPWAPNSLPLHGLHVACQRPLTGRLLTFSKPGDTDPSLSALQLCEVQVWGTYARTSLCACLWDALCVCVCVLCVCVGTSDQK